MSLVQSVVDRLGARCADGPSAPLHGVGRAADLMAARGELRRPVEAWVMGWDVEAASPRAATGPTRQLARESVIVLIGFLFAGPAGGAAEPETVEDAVVEALLGWTPPDRAEPLALRGARLLSFDAGAGTLFRQVVFETARARRDRLTSATLKSPSGRA
jgi:hypothetical protein